MNVYQNTLNGFLYSLKWVQERAGDPAVVYAIAQGHPGAPIREASRMDFVTLSPDALRRPAIPPVDPASSSSGVEK